jgi:hypothetical protein
MTLHLQGGGSSDGQTKDNQMEGITLNVGKELRAKKATKIKHALEVVFGSAGLMALAWFLFVGLTVTFNK